MQECGKTDKFVKTKLDFFKKADEEYIKISQDHARVNTLPKSVNQEISFLVRVNAEECEYEAIQHRMILERKDNKVRSK